MRKGRELGLVEKATSVHRLSALGRLLEWKGSLMTSLEVGIVCSLETKVIIKQRSSKTYKKATQPQLKHLGVGQETLPLKLGHNSSKHCTDSSCTCCGSRHQTI